MGIDGAYGYIYNWYGLHRLRQAVSTGILNNTAETPAIAMDGLFSSHSVRNESRGGPYEHPFLGKNIDFFI